MDFGVIDRAIETEILTIIDVVWRRKIAVVFTALVFFAILSAGILSLQPGYEASALLLANQGTAPAAQSVTAGQTVAQPVVSRLSLEQIALSDQVVAKAIEKVGLENLGGGQQSVHVSIFLKLRDRFFEDRYRPQPASAAEAWLPLIKGGLSARTEANSDVVTISYRNPNPQIAQEFCNAVVQAFIDRQIVLYSRPGVAEFLLRQKQRFDDEVAKASNQLATFSIASGTYAPEEQRKLLLTQISDLDTTLAATRAMIVGKGAARQAEGNELRRLSPVARSPWVSGLVDSLAGPMTGSAAKPPPLEDPPLLLIKVYQDSMVDLFKVNAEISGAQAQEIEQISARAGLMTKLNELTATEERYVLLKRRLDQAAANSNAYAKRVVEQEIDDASNAAKLSPIRVLQLSTIPLRPVFPNYIMMFAAALLVSTVASIGVAMLRTKSVRR